MKSNCKTIPRYALNTGLMILTLFVALVPSATAGNRAVKPRVEPVTVIGHVALQDAPASQMFLREHAGRQYLFIGDNSTQHFTVVDVTEPDDPNVIETVASPQDPSNGKLETVGTGLTLADGPARASQEVYNGSSDETVLVHGLMDPANPRAIQSFSEISSILSDDDRNLVYITNCEGLWILRLQPQPSAASKRHGCATEDASDEIAACQ
jgi:hypothetical protein